MPAVMIIMNLKGGESEPGRSSPSEAHLEGAEMEGKGGREREVTQSLASANHFTICGRESRIVTLLGDSLPHDDTAFLIEHAAAHLCMQVAKVIILVIMEWRVVILPSLMISCQEWVLSTQW